MLKVQQYLTDNGKEKLKEEFGVSIREYIEHGIMSVNYSQIDSPKHDPIIRECRGLILRNEYPYDVVSRTYDRFYNHGECPLTDRFNITEYIGWEKVDGSIMPVYFYNNQWNVATRKMVFAEGENGNGFVFREIFNSVFDYSILDNVDKDLVLIFEMVSSKNRIVKKYIEDAVYLTGVRNRVTGIEFNLEELQKFANELNLKLPELYRFDTIDEIFKSLSKIDAFDEGYIFVNYTTMHRIKIKNPSYLAIAHLRDNGIISPKRISILVWENDYDEYLNSFPEDREIFQPYIDAYGKLVDDIEISKEKYFSIEEQKDFALAIMSMPVKSILFQLRKGKSFEDVVTGLSDNSKISLLDQYR